MNIKLKQETVYFKTFVILCTDSLFRTYLFPLTVSRLILGAFSFFAPISVLVSGELRHVQAIPAAVSVPSRRKEEGDRSDLYDMIVVQTSVCLYFISSFLF